MAHGSTGWVSVTPASLAQLPEEQRREVARRRARHEEEQGVLLAVVEVRAFEHDEHAQVTFPPGAGRRYRSGSPNPARTEAAVASSISGWE